MIVQIGTKISFNGGQPETVSNIKLNYDYESVTVYFESGQSIGNTELFEAIDTGRALEVFA